MILPLTTYFHSPASIASTVLLLLQLPATVILVLRLAQGKNRCYPLEPQIPTPEMLGKVSILVPVLNEEKRLSPCLAGLSQQTDEVREIIVIDSHSQDNTVDLVKAAMAQDCRFRLVSYDPLPDHWVGPSGALQRGFFESSPETEWVLRLDADTRPRPGLVASLVKAAQTDGYDILSISSQFILKYPGEQWLHPALLATFAYRFVPVGLMAPSPQTVMANGQCFLCRRSVLEALEGFKSARYAFCDDVMLARYAAHQGFKVGFLDGSKLLKVRMYEGAGETWQGLGRTIALREASTKVQMWLDVGFLLLVQALPIPITVLLLGVGHSEAVPLYSGLLRVNFGLILLRMGILWALFSSYDRTQGKAAWLFWFSPLADPLAWIRVFLSATGKPRQWRGRIYR